MLTLQSGLEQNCQGLSRRSFLQIGSLGTLGLTLPTLLAQKKAALAANHSTKDVSCILLWTVGGTSHHDTFDPKPEAPASVKGEFGVIDTAVPGVKFTEIVPNMAKELNRFAILRGWNPQNAGHGLADQWVMSGQRVNPSTIHPTYGSVLSWQKGFQSALPPFVQLDSNVNRRQGGGTAGILGMQYNPFEVVADPNADSFKVRDITPPQGIDMSRVDRRRKMIYVIDKLQRQVDRQPAAFDALDEHYKAALNMITAPETKRAFDMKQEDPKLREKYGRNRLGQKFLLARRLVESGVRFVTVSDGGWDTHANNFKSLKSSRLPPVDQAIPALLADLEERGMLDSTLVLWLTDFGRTPKINSASGRDHWANAGFAMMAGAGVPGGSVLGATDSEGGHVARDEYLSEDIAATVYTKLGLPLHLVAHAPDGRPVPLITGRPIKEWC